ncbi:MAG: tryptophan synthase subunit alpha [Candidatus Humimicrobiaceae bacterium]
MIKDKVEEKNRNIKITGTVLNKADTGNNYTNAEKINLSKTNINENCDDAIKRKFEELKIRNRKGFIPFVTCGYPNLEDYIKLVNALDKNGADIVEIGIPFSDPLADGPIIQSTSKIALDGGINTDMVFHSVSEIRDKSSVPIVLMTYFNTIYKYGIEKFLYNASVSGVNGLIIPDLPMEEFLNYRDYFEDSPINNILLAALTSGEERLRKISSLSEGFLYCVSVKGVTGVRNSVNPDIVEFLKKLKDITDIPLALGFGISTIEQINEIKAYCDAIIMGSKILSLLLDSDNFKDGLKEVEKFVCEINLSLKS